jgi:excisionase family DNA binding protein
MAADRLSSALVEQMLEAVEADPILAHRLRAALALDPQPSGPVVFNTRTLAEEVGVSDETIRREIRSGRLRAQLRGKSYVITREAVEAWAARDDGPRVPTRSVRSPRPRGQRQTLRATLDNLTERH